MLLFSIFRNILSHYLKKNVCLQVAERIIAELRQQENEDRGFKLQLEIEEARLYWARVEQNTAKHLMKSLIGKLEKV